MKYTGFVTEEIATEREERQKELNDPNLNKARRKYLININENNIDYVWKKLSESHNLKSFFNC